jgi:hypothetical protein
MKYNLEPNEKDFDIDNPLDDDISKQDFLDYWVKGYTDDELSEIFLTTKQHIQSLKKRYIVGDKKHQTEEDELYKDIQELLREGYNQHTISRQLNLPLYYVIGVIEKIDRNSHKTKFQTHKSID